MHGHRSSMGANALARAACAPRCMYAGHTSACIHASIHPSIRAVHACMPAGGSSGFPSLSACSDGEDAAALIRTLTSSPSHTRAAAAGTAVGLTETTGTAAAAAGAAVGSSSVTSSTCMDCPTPCTARVVLAAYSYGSCVAAHAAASCAHLVRRCMHVWCDDACTCPCYCARCSACLVEVGCVLWCCVMQTVHAATPRSCHGLAHSVSVTACLFVCLPSMHGPDLCVCVIYA